VKAKQFIISDRLCSFHVDNVQAHKESPASTHKLIVILARIYFGLPMSLWAETVYEKGGRWLFRMRVERALINS